jgi:UDPglucose 6-dehydrogenase
MKITMLGTGYVGLVTGACFSNTGNDVTCADIDPAKIDMLKKGGCPIYEPGLEALLHHNSAAGRLTYTTNIHDAIRDAEIIFIAVGTPQGDDGHADLQYIWAAAKTVGEVIKELGPDAEPKIVVVKSTVPVGTTLGVKSRIAEVVKGLPFHVANNPEFLKEGAAINDFQKPDRVVIGVENDHTRSLLVDLYEPFVRQGNPIIPMDILSSEMVKYASNAMLATKISFINEVSRMCEAFGANVNRVRDGMCSDSRIGKHFLFPGLGYGGSCFPKDVRAFIGMGERTGVPTTLMDAVDKVNKAQREHFFSRVAQHFDEFDDGLKGKTIAFWGVAFKPLTDDIREAPALTLIQKAMGLGAGVRAFDPVAAENASKELGPGVTFCHDIYETIEGADALVICTEWDEFRSPDFARMRRLMPSKTIFDGRNVFRQEQMEREGFVYYSVGRAPINAEPARV